MTTAFVLSGGGSLGAVQVGMLQALEADGIAPDLLVGTSAGALNAAYVAGHGFTTEALSGLESVWRGLRRADVFPFEPARHLLALTGTRPSWCSPNNLGRLIRTHVPYRRLQDSSIPVHVVVTDVLSGKEMLLSHGDAVPAILASASIPGVFPAVTIAGRQFFDGGVANNTPITHAIALGADRVVVLPTGYACDLPAAPPTALANAIHAMTLLVQQRLLHEVAEYRGSAELVLLPPMCPVDVSPADFSQASVLITQARHDTGSWLQQHGYRQPQQERFLSMHDHSDADAPCIHSHGGHAA